MFGFLRVRRARTIIEQIGPGLADNLAKLPLVDRAATLAIVNAMLLAGGQQWGPKVAQAPHRLTKDTATEVIFELAERQSQVLNDVLIPLQKRNMSDVVYAQAMRQLRALELMIVTMGAAIDPLASRRAVAGWKVLLKARASASEAALVLIQYSQHAKARPLPAIQGKTLTRANLVELAQIAPPFLIKKTPAPKRISLDRRKALR